MPGLSAALQAFLAAGHFYGRDVIAEALAEIQGVEALPALVQASAVDLGDDQDTLQSIICDAMWGDIPHAQRVLDEIERDADPAVREVCQWAREMAEYLLERQSQQQQPATL